MTTDVSFAGYTHQANFIWSVLHESCVWMSGPQWEWVSEWASERTGALDRIMSGEESPAKLWLSSSSPPERRVIDREGVAREWGGKPIGFRASGTEQIWYLLPTEEAHTHTHTHTLLPHTHSPLHTCTHTHTHTLFYLIHTLSFHTQVHTHTLSNGFTLTHTLTLTLRQWTTHAQSSQTSPLI